MALQSLGRAQDRAAVSAEALARAAYDFDLLVLNEALLSGDVDRVGDAASKLPLQRPDDAEIARLNARLR